MRSTRRTARRTSFETGPRTPPTAADQLDLGNRYNRGHTIGMKTAIFICDEVFEAAERAAQALGLSRSQLYTRAVSEFVAHHQRESVTQRLDAVQGGDEATSRLHPAITALQARSLVAEDWE